jgi:glycosyltransferase involved in cell wall biosynthesis
MKVLWVKAGKLLPLDTGGKIRSYNILRLLAAQHQVTLLTYYSGQRDADYEQDIGCRFPGAVTFFHPASAENTVRHIGSYIVSLPFFAPFAVSKFTRPEVRRAAESRYRSRLFDIAVCDFLSASLNFPRRPAIPTVLFQHNVESTLWQRQARWEANWLKKLVLKIEAAKMTRYEQAALQKFDHIVAVSDQDREQMKIMVDASRISVVPTGVDLHQYRAVAGTWSEQPLVVFLGSMDWEANVDAAEYFCQDIWPLVLAKVPGARFRVVGRNPGPRVKRLASESVEVTGTVPSVIPHLRETRVFVVPLRIGGGTRLKMYEAMAMGKAVVSTSVGAEGLDVIHGRNILLADDAAAFAEGVALLLGDEELCRHYGAAAVELASQHDWSVVASRFADVLEAVARPASLDGKAAFVTESVNA